MNSLTNYLVEQILLEDTKITKIIAVFSGRFQPFHKGHYKTYQILIKKFGKENVYIGTSNVVTLPKSPFNFKEKSKIIATMFGISKSKIVQIKNPYKPIEILSKFDENSTAYVTAVGEKDASRLGGKYFTKYDGTPTESYKDKGYIFISPTQSNTISGTSVRNGLSLGSEEDKKKFFEKMAYNKYNPSIFDLITSKLQESVIITKESIEDWLIKESTIGAIGQADDGPSAFYSNLDVFSKMSLSRAKQIGYDVIDMIMTKEVEDYYEYPTYPNGPVKAVSYYPAGVIGAMTPNNQIDIYSSKAFSQWYKHVTRKAMLSGYELITTQIERDILKKEKELSVDMAKANKEIEAEFELLFNESIILPIEIGDMILMGKWKNKKVIVKTIGKDEHGMPTINGKKVVTFRYGKKRTNIFENYVVLEDLTTGFKNLGVERKEMPQINAEDLKNYVNYIKRKGYTYKILALPVSTLNLTQKEINKDKIEDMMNIEVATLAKPVVISKGRYILDGHHRVLALYSLNQEAKIPVVQVDLGIKELLKVSRNWNGAEFNDVNEINNQIDKLSNTEIRESINDLVKDMDESLESFVLPKQIIKEGGTWGHMNHPFDTEINLTFAQLKDIVNKALDGNLEFTREKCISGDSIIKTENNGDISIHKFVDNNIDDKILSYNEQSQTNEYKEVISKVNNDTIDEWLEIELEDGKIIHVTSNHRIFVEGIGYVQAKDLTEDMELKVLQ